MYCLRQRGRITSNVRGCHLAVLLSTTSQLLWSEALLWHHILNELSHPSSYLAATTFFSSTRIPTRWRLSETNAVLARTRLCCVVMYSNEKPSRAMPQSIMTSWTALEIICVEGSINSQDAMLQATLLVGPLSCSYSGSTISNRWFFYTSLTVVSSLHAFQCSSCSRPLFIAGVGVELSDKITSSAMDDQAIEQWPVKIVYNT